jgi:hypothetical protein
LRKRDRRIERLKGDTWGKRQNCKNIGRCTGGKNQI